MKTGEREREKGYLSRRRVRLIENGEKQWLEVF
jgi:hypothetical protein